MCVPASMRVCVYVSHVRVGEFPCVCVCMYLVVATVLLPALAALQEVCGGASGLGHLVLSDGLLGENVPQLLQLVARHFLNTQHRAGGCTCVCGADQILTAEILFAVWCGHMLNKPS